MGTWGTGMSGNDTFCEVYERFCRLYNGGAEPEQITKVLQENFKETIDFREVTNEFWFALAKAQWECKALQPWVYEKVKAIIDSKADLEIWKELGATPRQIRQREKALANFLSSLAKEKTKARRRKKSHFKPAVFQKGDCVVFKMSSGKYGGAFVLETNLLEESDCEINYMIKTKINMERKPTMDDFARAAVFTDPQSELYRKGLMAYELTEASWFFPDDLRKYQEFYEVIGSLMVERVYDHHGKVTCFSGPWEVFIRETEKLFHQEALSLQQEVRLKELI